MSTDFTQLSKHDQKEIKRLMNYKKLDKQQRELESMNENTLLGEWDTDNQFFWFGSNNQEYIAFHNAAQILVYPCYDPSHRPSAIIENDQRIKTLEDFSNTLRNGKTLNLSFTPETHTESTECAPITYTHKLN